ncbi:MAG: hypothetical protein NTZ38_03635 [Candidatus Taylorbacteria bacterium]|nr:hypothetical protein [Candidatus Taylorbacteria bacterium]
MNSERLKFPTEEDKPESGSEAISSPEESHENQETMGGVEAIVGTLILGMKIKRFFDSKGSEMGKVFDEAKEDFKSQPTALKEIMSNSIASFGSLVLEHQREQKEQKLKIKQKFLDSLQRINAQRDQLDVLDNFEKLQEEAITETANMPHEKVNASSESKRNFKSSIENSAQAKKEKAKSEVEMFVNGLLKMFG